MNDSEEYKKFIDELKKETERFYKFSRGKFRISDRVLEYIVYSSETNCGRSCIWDPYSHKPGMDMNVMSEPVSCKSAKVKKEKFEISSYRLSQCETPEQLITEISLREKTYSKYLVCLTEEYEDRHKIRWGFIEKSKAEDMTNTDWIIKYKKKNKTKISTIQSTNKKFKINWDLSKQLWIKLDLTYVDIIYEKEYILKDYVNAS